MKRTPVTALLGLSVCGAAAGAVQPVGLEPAWTRGLAERIEWAALIEDARPPAVLVCTAGARLLLLDLETGAARFGEPVQAAPGVRLAAGRAGQVAYCYDRFSAYALATCPRPDAAHATSPLRWQAGEWPAAARTYQGDPEFMTRIVAAHAAPAGLLLARSDGRVALLGAQRGRTRRSYRLPRLSECRILLRGATAALVFQAGDEARVAFLDLADALAGPAIRTLGRTRPIWTGLLDGPRLLAVWPLQARLTAPDGRSFSFEPADEDTFRASALGMFLPATGGVSRPARGGAASGALLLASPIARGGQARVRAYGLADGRVVWRAAAAARPQALLTSLRVRGGRVLLTTRRSLDVYAAPSGAALGGYAAGQGARLLDATVVGQIAYGLLRAQPSGPEGERDEGLTLVRLRLGGAPSGPQRPRHVRRYRLRAARPGRQVLWGGRHLLLVGKTDLASFALP